LGTEGLPSALLRKADGQSLGARASFAAGARGSKAQSKSRACGELVSARTSMGAVGNAGSGRWSGPWGRAGRLGGYGAVGQLAGGLGVGDRAGRRGVVGDDRLTVAWCLGDADRARDDCLQYDVAEVRADVFGDLRR